MAMSLLTLLLLLAGGCSTGSGTHIIKFSGRWHHGRGPLTLHADVAPGCESVTVSANDSSLSVAGLMTAECTASKLFTVPSQIAPVTDFCVYWEPSLDELLVEVSGMNFTLCEPSFPHSCCCTDLSSAAGDQPEATHGIGEACIRGDPLSLPTRTGYIFSCGAEPHCDKASQRSNQVKVSAQVVCNDGLPCTNATVVVMDEDFQGFTFTVPAPQGVAPESSPSIHLPSSLKPAAGKTAKVVCTFFKTKTHFEEPNSDVKTLEDVVGITVENEIIANLPEPVRISFYHGALPETFLRKCVSWDTRRDPLKVTWKEDGCMTDMKDNKTECHCNHLTYFSVMVQLKYRPVPHLLALTVVTSLGNAVSTISCIALMIFLCNKRRVKEQSSPIHFGLAASLFLLNVLFFFTGTLANVAGQVLCPWVASGLHYALLSSFTWMAIEVFYTFWLIYKVFSPSPKTYIWYLIGFGLPAIPVIILLATGSIYGIMKVVPSEDPSESYSMCWMTDTREALLAHYLTNISMLVLLVSSGLVMLFLVYWKIHTRDEWRQKKVTFFSIWGLSCLFGTTWGLGLLGVGPFADFALFLSCFLNSFQGFFLMLRFFVLGWMKRREAGHSSLGRSSLNASTRQQML